MPRGASFGVRASHARAEDRCFYEHETQGAAPGRSQMSPTSAIKNSAAAAAAEIPMLIGGEWRAASETYEVRDPYRNTVVSHAPRSCAVPPSC